MSARPTDPRQDELGAIFHALSDGHRRSILHRLERRPCSVSELAAPLPISLAATSKHVQVLERAGLVRKTVEGRRHVCRLDGTALQAAHGWLGRYERFWSARLDDLERRLREDPTVGGDDG
jgi:DNA-binding transcriptional ArsR family regulator